MSDILINEKLNVLNSITDMEILRPTVPVSVVLLEAANLFEWCARDKEDLIKAGLDWKLVEDLNIRAGALRVSQAKWSREYKSYQDCQAEWKIKAPEAFNLRDELVHDFYHALYKIPNEYSKVQRIAEGTTNADMLQDLIDLSELGLKHSALLEAIGFDLSKLDLARSLSFELTELLAKVNGTIRDTSPLLELRDKAYTHLKESVDEIRRIGQYIFWRDPKNYKGYVSEYSQQKNRKSRKNEPVENTTA